MAALAIHDTFDRTPYMYSCTQPRPSLSGLAAAQVYGTGLSSQVLSMPAALAAMRPARSPVGLHEKCCHAVVVHKAHKVIHCGNSTALPEDTTPKAPSF